MPGSQQRMSWKAANQNQTIADARHASVGLVLASPAFFQTSSHCANTPHDKTDLAKTCKQIPLALILNSAATSKQLGCPLPSGPTRDQPQPWSHGRLPAHGAAEQETRVCKQLSVAGRITRGHASRNAPSVLPRRGKGCSACTGLAQLCTKEPFGFSIQNKNILKKSQLGPLLHPDTPKVSHNSGRLHAAVKIASSSKRQQLLPTLI